MCSAPADGFGGLELVKLAPHGSTLLRTTTFLEKNETDAYSSVCDSRHAHNQVNTYCAQVTINRMGCVIMVAAAAAFPPPSLRHDCFKPCSQRVSGGAGPQNPRVL